MLDGAGLLAVEVERVPFLTVEGEAVGFVAVVTARTPLLVADAALLPTAMPDESGCPMTVAGCKVILHLSIS
jgi:hypothetical protein